MSLRYRLWFSFAPLLLLLVIPVPVGELFHKMLEERRRAHAAKVVKKENPD